MQVPCSGHRRKHETRESHLNNAGCTVLTFMYEEPCPVREVVFGSIRQKLHFPADAIAMLPAPLHQPQCLCAMACGVVTLVW